MQIQQWENLRDRRVALPSPVMQRFFTIATFNITVMDDSSDDGTQTVTISVSADGWTSGSDTIAIRNTASSGGGSSGGCFIETLRREKKT